MNSDAEDPPAEVEHAASVNDVRSGASDEASEPADTRSYDDANEQGSVDSSRPGDGLSHEEAGRICAQRDVTVVVLAGGARSGKTTLLTSVYEHLNEEPMLGWQFAWSNTLYGFERRAHGGRQASGFCDANTERSSRLQPPWLHLRLRHPALGNRELLLADISGELYDELVRGKTSVAQHPELRRADHVCVVLDGRKLADPTENHAERARAETLARILREDDAVVSPLAVSVVVTKLDELLGDQVAIGDQLAVVLDKIRAVAGFSAELPMWRTAAQPRTSAFPAGHGVEALFGQWLAMPRRDRLNPPEPRALPSTVFARLNFGPRS